MRRSGKPHYADTFIGFNYVQINLPLIIFGKVGYTRLFSGILKRAKSTSKSAPGIMLPIMFCLLPFPWHVEQAIHRLISDFQFSFYKGDGHTETYNIFGVVFAWSIYAAINLCYIECAYQQGWIGFGAMDVIVFTVKIIKAAWAYIR